MQYVKKYGDISEMFGKCDKICLPMASYINISISSASNPSGSMMGGILFHRIRFKCVFTHLTPLVIFLLYELLYTKHILCFSCQLVL